MATSTTTTGQRSHRHAPCLPAARRSQPETAAVLLGVGATAAVLLSVGATAASAGSRGALPAAESAPCAARGSSSPATGPIWPGRTQQSGQQASVERSENRSGSSRLSRLTSGYARTEMPAPPPESNRSPVHARLGSSRLHSGRCTTNTSECALRAYSGGSELVINRRSRARATPAS